MTCPLTLNCLVLGQASNNIFQVTLDRTQSIADLRKGIQNKKQPSFDHVVADTLVLWQVSVPVDSKLVESLKHAEKNPLSFPDKELGHIFQGDKAKARYLHVVVQQPRLPDLSITSSEPDSWELFCLVFGDSPSRIFPVEIAMNESVGSLKEAIKQEKRPSFDYVPAETLVLWKVSISGDDIFNNNSLPKNLNEVANKRLLSAPMNKLSKVFSDVPREKHLHIIVEPPTIGDTDRGREGRRDTISVLKARFESVIAGILKATAPSDSAKSSAYAKSQIAYSIYDGRYKAENPRTSVAPPIQLFHPAFGHFLDTFSNTNIIPDDDMIRKTTDYMKAASAIYPDEMKRNARLTPILGDILMDDLQTIINDDKTHTDGIIERSFTEGHVLLLLKEGKNEFGDPSTQAGLSVARHWAQSKFKRFRNATSCPTFLIATVGPWITILGVVITDVVVVQRLTDSIWAGLDSVHNEPQITYVARTLFALSLGVSKLDSYYRCLKPGPDDTPPLGSRYFPSITTYCENDTVVEFEYVGYLENGLYCVTLRARTHESTPRDIVVKFVDRYGESAHKALADVGLAPKLLYCESPHLSGEQPSYRSLFMVAMEYIDGYTLAAVEAKLDHKTTARVQSEIKQALDVLHRSGLVFGDLRSPNIMIDETEKVKLIDFNWAGVQGRAKYPYLISKNIWWPEGVEALAIIEYDHDMEMFKQMFTWLCLHGFDM